MILLIATAIFLAGPLVVGAIGLTRAPGLPREGSGVAERASGSAPTILSTALAALAFNLTFLIQELFLVLPKALTPGLHPTLYHNNHSWTGDNPLAALFQGTGALATLVTGIGCGVLLHSGAGRTRTQRLFLFWMAYCGIFMALPQVVVGAVNPDNDVGMAMGYLGLSTGAKNVLALATAVAMPLIALGFLRPLCGLATDPSAIATPGARTRWVLRVAMIPALLVVVISIPFRVPRELIEVVLLPAIVMIPGTAWMQAGAWRETRASPAEWPRPERLVGPLAALAVLLAFFQLVLRPGIRFY